MLIHALCPHCRCFLHIDEGGRRVEVAPGVFRVEFVARCGEGCEVDEARYHQILEASGMTGGVLL